jgi:hypothetical protein
LEVIWLSLELIGEFSGKNAVNRILPDGKMETSNQGMGKILATLAFVISTAVVTVLNETYTGEVNSLLTTMDGDAVMLKGNVVSWQSGKGGMTRVASMQTTQSQKLMRLNKAIVSHEYITDEGGNWTGKLWEWK